MATLLTNGWSWSDDFNRANAADLTAVNNGWTGRGGVTANITSNDLVMGPSGAYRQLLNAGDGNAPADYEVSVVIPHASRSSFIYLNGRWNGTNGVRCGFSVGATSIAGVRFGDASSHNAADQAGTVDDGLPASWAVNQDHTMTMRMVGSLITLIIDGQQVAHATVATNQALTGTSFGVAGDSAARVWRSVGASGLSVGLTGSGTLTAATAAATVPTEHTGSGALSASVTALYANTPVLSGDGSLTATATAATEHTGLIGDVPAFYVGSTPVTAIYAGSVKVWPAPIPIPTALSGGGMLSASAFAWTPLAIPGLHAWIDPSQDAAAYGPNENILTAAMSINEVGNYTIGVQFRPTTTGRITHIRANIIGGSHTFTLWTDGGGARLSTVVDVSSGPREWRSVALPTPVNVVAGTTYVATFSTNGVGFGRNSGAIPPPETPNVTVLSHRYSVGVDVFPLAGAGANHYGVDVVYQKAAFADGQVLNSYTSHDPTGLVFTADAGEQPTYRVIGGKPQLDFNYSSLEAVTHLGTSGFTWVIVARHAAAFTGPSGYEMLMSYNSSTGDGLDYELRHPGSAAIQAILEYNLNFLAPVTGFGAVPDTDYAYILTADQATTDARLYVNDTEVLSNNLAPQALPTAATDLCIGKRQGWALYKGLVSEVLVFRGAISDTDRARLWTYLSAKWGVGAPMALQRPVLPTPEPLPLPPHTNPTSS